MADKGGKSICRPYFPACTCTTVWLKASFATLFISLSKAEQPSCKNNISDWSDWWTIIRDGHFQNDNQVIVHMCIIPCIENIQDSDPKTLRLE